MKLRGRVVDDSTMKRRLGMSMRSDLQSEESSILEDVMPNLGVRGTKVVKFDIGTLMPNFNDLFKNSVAIPNSRFSQIESTPKSAKWITIRAIARGDTKWSPKSHRYSLAVRFLRSSADVPITPQTMVEVKCSCPAFNFFLAYVLWKGKSHLGKPKAKIKQPPDIRNPRRIPTVCKHLQGFLGALIQDGVIEIKKSTIVAPSGK